MKPTIVLYTEACEAYNVINAAYTGKVQFELEIAESFDTDTERAALEAAAGFRPTKVAVYGVCIDEANHVSAYHIVVLTDGPYPKAFMLPNNFTSVQEAAAYLHEATTQQPTRTLSADHEARLSLVHNLFTAAYNAVDTDLELAARLLEGIKKQYIICGVPYVACGGSLENQIDAVFSSFPTFEDMVSRGTCQNNEAI